MKDQKLSSILKKLGSPLSVSKKSLKDVLSKYVEEKSVIKNEASQLDKKFLKRKEKMKKSFLDLEEAKHSYKSTMQIKDMLIAIYENLKEKSNQ